MAGGRLAFGPFEVDADAQVVLQDGAPLPIGQRGVHLLGALLSRPGEVLTKGELMDAAWPGMAVEESNLSVQIASLRKTLGTAPDGNDWIATVPRVGYRFVGASAPPVPAEPEHRSIAVLPFDNLSSDPEQSFFADGLAEEIITALSKVPGLLVIARASSFGYRGATVDIRRVAQELEVTFVLAGSVRRAGNRLRMSVQLVDGTTGRHLWADTYDRELTDVFAVQDEVTRNVVAALSVRLSSGHPRLLTGSDTSDLGALDLLLRGRAALSEAHQSREVNDRGTRLLQEAAARDPSYAEPLIHLVIAHATAFSNRWTDDPAATLDAARVAGNGAVALAPDYAEARAARSLVALLERDHDRMGAETGLAVSLNPFSSFSNVMRGGWLVNDSQPLAAIPHFEQALRVNPGMAHLYVHHLGTAYLGTQSWATAAALFRSRIAMSPGTDMSRGYLCVALGHLGEHEEARRVWAELLEITPGYSLSQRLNWFYYRDPADPERLLEGLRKAGLPAGTYQQPPPGPGTNGS